MRSQSSRFIKRTYQKDLFKKEDLFKMVDFFNSNRFSVVDLFKMNIIVYESEFNLFRQTFYILLIIAFTSLIQSLDLLRYQALTLIFLILFEDKWYSNWFECWRFQTDFACSSSNTQFKSIQAAICHVSKRQSGYLEVCQDGLWTKGAFLCNRVVLEVGKN